MFHSKTEHFDENENEFNTSLIENPTLVNFHHTEIALAKALDNIGQLQQNLSFMLELNQKLRTENERLKSSQQKGASLVNLQMSKKERQIQMMRQENENIADLLQEAKKSLISSQQDLIDSKEEIARKQRIIREQKKAYEELENKFMNESVSYLNIGDTSSMCGKNDYQYISELEKENNQLQILLKRLEQQNEKLEQRSAKAEKEITDFKKWMGSLLGMQRVVEGSEKILMKEIAQRILPP